MKPALVLSALLAVVLCSDIDQDADISSTMTTTTTTTTTTDAAGEAETTEGPDEDDNNKRKRTIGGSLGYGYMNYNRLPSEYGDGRSLFSQLRTPAATQQYQTIRYYESGKASAGEQQPHYVVDNNQHQQPATMYNTNHNNGHLAAHQQVFTPTYLTHANPLLTHTSPLLTHTSPLLSPLMLQQSNQHSFLQQSPQLIPVVILRVADPAHHGLATQGFLQTTTTYNPQHHFQTPNLQALLLHYLQAQTQTPVYPQHQQHLLPTPPIMKPFFVQQQQQHVTPTPVEKKPLLSTTMAHKPRKTSVTIEQAHNLDHVYNQYKFSQFKDKI